MDMYSFQPTSPYSVLGGSYMFLGYSSTANMYSWYLGIINGDFGNYDIPPIASYDAPIDLSMDFRLDEQGNYALSADVEILDNFISNDTKIIFITKKFFSVGYFATVNNIETLDFNLSEIGQTASFNHTFQSDGSNIDDITAVVLIQDVGGTPCSPNSNGVGPCGTRIFQAAQMQVNQDTDSDGIISAEDNCPDIYNPDQLDDDGDGFGNLCDICDNVNVFIPGNVNGDLNETGEPLVNFFDVVDLIDYLALEEQTITPINECKSQAGNVNFDNNVNIIDVVNLVNMVLFNNVPSMQSNTSEGILSIVENTVAGKIIIESDSEIGGFQFRLSTLTNIDKHLDNILLPEGWSIKYISNDNEYSVYAFDASGVNSSNELVLNIPNNSVLDVKDIVIASKEGFEIKTSYNKDTFAQESISLPNRPNIHSLYPNPFNPFLTVSYSLPSETTVSISIYNMLGERVSTLINELYLTSGFHRVSWDASAFPSGMYFVKIQTPTIIETKKALLLK